MIQIIAENLFGKLHENVKITSLHPIESIRLKLIEKEVFVDSTTELQIHVVGGTSILVSVLFGDQIYQERVIEAHPNSNFVVSHM